MKKLVSVIIPCFNVEEYVERCIDSLVKQSIGLDNIELIFVNDASEDKTLEVLKRYENKYSETILIIDLEQNLRQGGARNIGMQYASADYIGFVDADDWVESDMYEKLYKKALEQDCDIVVCGYKRDTSGNEIMGGTGREDELIIIDSIEKRKALIVEGIAGGIWSKLYKKELLVQHNIQYPEKLFYEDNYFTSILFLYVERVYNLEEYLYHYCIRYGSTVSTANSLHQLDRLTIELMKLDEYKNRGVFELFQKEIESVFLKMFYLNTLHTLFIKFTVLPYNVFLYMQKCVIRMVPEYKSNPYMSKEQRKWMETIEENISEEELNEIASKYQDSIRLR